MKEPGNALKWWSWFFLAAALVHLAMSLGLFVRDSNLLGLLKDGPWVGMLAASSIAASALYGANLARWRAHSLEVQLHTLVDSLPLDQRVAYMDKAREYAAAQEASGE